MILKNSGKEQYGNPLDYRKFVEDSADNMAKADSMAYLRRLAENLMSG
ncbi:hypothetical protein H0A66_11535 [Alcaligenaceae bacterium]|nr:hypothetical protein [Alcaligenaceae bacterium]